MMKNLRPFHLSSYFYLLVIWSTGLFGCYSFTGASVPHHWKSITIQLFDDESTYGQPALRDKITNLLIEKVQRDNTLQIGERPSASVDLLGTITEITADQPIAIAQGAQASKLQVVIKATVTLMDNVFKKQVWNKMFTATGDYIASGGTAEREAGLQRAIEKLTDDILLDTISAW